MFSIIIPIYNKLPHLERSINSVLNQTFSEFELILINDASTDGSREKLESFIDPRIRVLDRNTPGSGGYAARNLGIQSSKFEWISFLDADDEWDLNYLKSVYSVINKYKEVELISVGWKESIEEKVIHSVSNDIDEQSFTLSDYLLNHQYMWTGAITIRKDLICRAGIFPTDLSCKRGGDVDTWIRNLNESRLSIKLNRTLSYYYKDTINRVTDNSRNPTVYFCAYNTLMNLYKKTDDRVLRKIIRDYINIKIFQIMTRNQKIHRSLVSKMFITSYSLKNVPKLFLKNYILK